MDQKLNGAKRRIDPVADAIDDVRADLAARRAAGEIPELPPGELERQFSAVVEAADGLFVDEPPLDASNLAPLAAMATWEPPQNGLRGRTVGRLRWFWSRAVGTVVRRQVAPWAHRTTHVVEQVVARQNRVIWFLGRVHLDRVRSLEYRVAELEREVERLRAAPPAGHEGGSEAI